MCNIRHPRFKVGDWVDMPTQINGRQPGLRIEGWNPEDVPVYTFVWYNGVASWLTVGYIDKYGNKAGGARAQELEAELLANLL